VTCGRPPTFNRKISFENSSIERPPKFPCSVKNEEGLPLINANAPVLAAIHLPVMGVTYTALKGEGAQVNGREMYCSETQSLRHALVSIDQYTHTKIGSLDSDTISSANDLRTRLHQKITPHVQRIRVTGTSSIDLAWTASGNLDACIVAANKPWDTAGGGLLATEAGAVLVDVKGRTHSFESSTTVAASPGIITELLAVIEDD
jgi:myo-inositol-1(or 4)-monophosphatase